MIHVVAALLLRALHRVVDVAILSGPLRTAYLVAWRGLPSPYRPAFSTSLVARQRGVDEGSLVYGEAFVGVARGILARHGCRVGSVVVDLGCGRGNVLLAARSLGAGARGVEILPVHVEVVAAALAAVGAVVEVGDARDAVVDDASHVWLSWATWSPDQRAAVTTRLRGMAAGSVVVGVVHGVDDPAFVAVEHARAAFSWGFADVVVSRRR